MVLKTEKPSMSPYVSYHYVSLYCLIDYFYHEKIKKFLHSWKLLDSII